MSIQEQFIDLFQSDAFRVEKIISPVNCELQQDWYDQTEHEWVHLIQGSAVLEFEDKTVPLAAGDSIEIPAHTKHRVLSTSSEQTTIWFAVFYRWMSDEGIRKTRSDPCYQLLLWAWFNRGCFIIDVV